MFRERRWQELIDLIDHLGDATFTREAQANDEEYVRAALASLDGRPMSEYHPPLHEYGPVVSRLDRLVDAIKANTIATIKSAGSKKPIPFDPEPRPESAFSRIAHRARTERHDRTVSRVLGPRDKGEDPPGRHRRTVERLMNR